MPLVTPHDLYRRAAKEGWALGAFNTQNLETTQGIAWALANTRSPGILQASERAIRYAGLTVLRDLIRDVADTVNVPLILHLDHGRSLETVQHCLDAGYQSVMIDGSLLPLAKNVALTRTVVDLAHAKGAWVEGEVGAVPGKEVVREGRWEIDEALLTDPEKAADFVKSTGVDALAVSVGTLHGAFRGTEGIRFERLRAIHEAVEVPLVLHGGSGLPADDIRRAIGFGIVKVNIDTELREAFHGSLAGHREDAPGHSIDPRSLMSPTREAIGKVVAEKVVLLGSAGKAG